MLNTLPLIWDIMSIGAILVMHHYTFNEKYKSEELIPHEKTYSDITEAQIDNCSSLDEKSYRDKKNFKSSLTVSEAEDSSGLDRQERNRLSHQTIGSKQEKVDTFAYQSVDKFDIDRTFNTATSFSDTEKNLARLCQSKIFIDSTDKSKRSTNQ